MTAIGTALSAILPPLLALGAVLAAVYVGFQQFGDYLSTSASAFGEIFAGVGSDIMEIVDGIWAFIGPPLSFLGGIIGGAVLAAFRILGGVIRVLLLPLRLLAVGLRAAGNFLRPVFAMLGEMFLTFFEHLGELGNAFSRFATWLGLSNSQPSLGQSQPGFLAQGLAALRNAWNGPGATQGSAGGGAAGSAPGVAPGGRGGSVTNIGTVNINQEFREADPDRVWIQMRDAMEREAVSRTQSGFANALTR